MILFISAAVAWIMSGFLGVVLLYEFVPMATDRDGNLAISRFLLGMIVLYGPVVLAVLFVAFTFYWIGCLAEGLISRFK